MLNLDRYALTNNFGHFTFNRNNAYLYAPCYARIPITYLVFFPLLRRFTRASLSRVARFT